MCRSAPDTPPQPLGFISAKNVPRHSEQLPILMKTNLRSKLRTLAFLGIAIIAAASTQPLFAVPLDLQITENSSTSLSATLDGSAVPVQNTAADRWTLTFADTFVFAVFDVPWVEPDGSPSLGNFVSGTGTNQLFVLSDFPVGDDTPDGTTQTQSVFISGIRTDINITFHDHGDGATVPDTGATLGLLFLAMIAVAGARYLSTTLSTRQLSVRT
jgi:hypothetical protein